jgi:hypothetical protein
MNAKVHELIQELAYEIYDLDNLDEIYEELKSDIQRALKGEKKRLFYTGYTLFINEMRRKDSLTSKSQIDTLWKGMSMKKRDFYEMAAESLNSDRIKNGFTLFIDDMADVEGYSLPIREYAVIWMNLDENERQYYLEQEGAKPAFLNYRIEKRKEYLINGDREKMGEVDKAISHNWRYLSPEEKEQYKFL